ncbi:alpha/beta-hydrolase [Cystobasidium minutum MCA 4210]|uniref:alpha/beta-hydrolase n=1 Tax=Cystobasidium minutum MCA 4210 TaxID=1397322 RepID=UPI0034CF0A46|eukprot:jgi/Rhomi1/160772/estExt_Genewise1Plus.C_4_t20233
MADAPKTQYLKSEHNAGQVTAYRVYEKRSGRSTTPLVMIQGLSAVGTIDYHDLAQALSKNRTVVTFDNRDIGESTWGKNPSPFTLEDLARDVAHLIQHLQYKEVDVLGHSMGGMIAQTLITLPDLPFSIKHAVLGATCAKNPKSDLGKAMAGYLRKVQAAGKKPDPREMSEVMTRNCYDEEWINGNPELYEKRIQEAISTRRPAATIALQQKAIGKYDVREKLRSVPSSLKVLVIHGQRDVAVYPEEVDDIVKAIPHAQVLKKAPGPYAHNWYDYFGSEFWEDQLRAFLDSESPAKANL